MQYATRLESYEKPVSEKVYGASREVLGLSTILMLVPAVLEYVRPSSRAAIGACLVASSLVSIGVATFGVYLMDVHIGPRVLVPHVSTNAAGL